MARFRKKTAKKKTVLEEPKRFTYFLEDIKEIIVKRRKPFIVTASILLTLIAGFLIFTGVNLYFNKKASGLESEASRYYYASQPASKDMLLKAIKLYQEVVSKYPRTKTAPIAQFQIGNCYFRLGDPDNAIKAYTVFAEKYGKATWMLPMVYQKMAYAYELKGDRSEAIKAMERTAAIKGALTDMSYYEMGRLKESAGKPEEAVRDFKKVVEEYPFSPWSQEAAEALKRLKAEDVRPSSEPKK